MKVLVNTEFLELGGSIVTAVELAAAVRDLHGVDVVMFARNGPARRLLEDRGLPLVAAEHHGGSELSFVRSLRAACATERPDLVHAWDRRAIHAAFYGAQVSYGIPVLGSVTEMLVPSFLPRGLAITYVTEEIRRRDVGRELVMVQDPPVNARSDAPGVVDPAGFLSSAGLDAGAVHLVIVSRLAVQMKLESTLHAIDAVRRVGAEHALDLTIVGDGPARAQVEAAATEANAALGRTAVRLVGAMVDPRPAYAAADVVIGMGTSVVRGMCFAKPVVVVGELGYAEILDQRSAPRIARSGFYGFGSGSDIGGRHLAGLLVEMLQRRGEWEEMGRLGRQLAETTFDTPIVASRLYDRYRTLVAAGPVRRGPLLVAGNLARTALALGVAAGPDRLRELLGENTDGRVNRLAHQGAPA